MAISIALRVIIYCVSKKNKMIMKIFLTLLLGLVSCYSTCQYKIGFNTGLNFAGSKVNTDEPFPDEHKNLLSKERASLIYNLNAEMPISKKSSLLFKLGLHTNRDVYFYDFESIYPKSYTQNMGIEYGFERKVKVKSRFFRFSMLHQSYFTLSKDKVSLLYNIGGGLGYWIFNNAKVDLYTLNSDFNKGGLDKTMWLKEVYSYRENLELFIESSLGLEFTLSPALGIRLEGTYLASLDDLNPHKKPISTEFYDKYNVVNTTHYGYFTRSISVTVGLTYFIGKTQ